MDLHNGTLSVTSEGEGHGSTFTITLPAKYIENAINIEVPEYKVEEEAVRVVRASSSESTNYNYRIYNASNRNNASSKSNELLHSSTIEIDAGGRTSHTRRANSVMSLGSASSKVAPLLRSDSLGSICAPISIEASYDKTSLNPSNRRMPPLKVLVVDDSVSNRKMLMRLLRDRCSLIGEAVDGVDAVTQIKAVLLDDEQRQYDAILMDFIMPNMEGPEAAKCIRELGFQGLIVGITGNVLPVDKDRFLSRGADLVLTKPVNILDIDDAFRRIPYPPTTTITATFTSTPLIM